MAAANATVFPVRAQAFRVHFEFVTVSTGATFSGSLSALAATVIIDGAPPVSSSGTLTQIGTSGICYLDLTAAEMTASSVIALATCSNSGVVARPREIAAMNLAQFAGRWDAQSILRYEQLIHDLFYLLGGNGASQTGADLAYLNEDGSVHFHCPVVQNTTTGTKGKPA